MPTWNVRLIGHDPYVSDDRFRELEVTRTAFDQFLQESDIITSHVVLTSETEGMLGRRELEKMKPTAIVINTARGGVVDEEELCRALTTNAIAGAAIDTFSTEPLPASSQLRDIDSDRLIPSPTDHDRCAHSRCPIDMIFQG